MADGLWVSGRSRDVVAGEFGVSPATVKDWATSASRVLRIHVEGDPGEIRARLVATLETIVSKAMSKEFSCPSVDDGPPVTLAAADLKNAIAAIAEQGKLLGLHTEHLVHSGEVTEKELGTFRSAIVALLCTSCREKVLAQVRQRKDRAK